jgi:iron complex transport system substrate-binding protein
VSTDLPLSAHRSPSRAAPTRRQFLLGLSAAALLAACGADDSGSSGPSDEATGTRTVEGAYGPIEIPNDPERILADLMTVDYLTALGYDTSKIIGVFDASFFKGEEGHYLTDFFEGQELIDPGGQYELNLEAIAAAEPDLILVPFDQIDRAPDRENLAKIAPLLAVPTSEPGDSPEVRFGGTASFQDWRTTLRKYGELLDRADEAEAYIAETEEQLAAIAKEHGPLIASISATEAKSTGDFVAINVLNTAKTSGVLGTIIMSELGFKAPAAQAEVLADEYGTIEISSELTGLLDGDLLFLEVRQGSKRHEESPLWSTLGVVQNDGVVVVGNHWEFGGAVAARRVIDDIDRALDELAARRG